MPYQVELKLPLPARPSQPVIPYLTGSRSPPIRCDRLNFQRKPRPDGAL
jgi:hypothetical protein